MPSVQYTLGGLLGASQDEVLGRLAIHYAQMGFAALWTTAVDAWKTQLPLIQDAARLAIHERPDARLWTILLEYSIPLRDRRPDAIILATNVIFVIEFKIGAESYDSGAAWQVQSYALDLRDFHPRCAGKAIIPILVATRKRPQLLRESPRDAVAPHRSQFSKQIPRRSGRVFVISLPARPPRI